MTSVKEFVVEAEPTPEDLGRGRFVFTDDYSVFDWGKMPDPIPEKGASLCTMGAFNFGLLRVNEVPTHFRGVVVDGQVRRLEEVETPPREMAIELTQVPDLPHEDGRYDYDAYHAAAGENFLIPLEVVFRNSVPAGSSLRDRREPRAVGLDREEWPAGTVDLPEPLVEFSTKFEEQDRYLDREAAARIAGKADLDRLERLARAVNVVLTRRAERRGFTHEDGKIECLYHDGAIKVADVAGTFDENRFSYDGQEVSKEVVRRFYRREHPAWVEAVTAAKREARERGVADWRTLCAESPPALPERVVGAVADLYAAGTNAYTDRAWFDAPPIEEAVAAVRDLD
ncbi:MAG: phosphoribosylaminoimidazolesuccinocarboxamide synthase [Haloferacaceae archaeon]